MFCSIDPETRETNTQQHGEIISDPLANIRPLCVEISQAYQPGIVQHERVTPRRKTALAMEVTWTIRDGGEFTARGRRGVRRHLVCERVSKERASSCGFFPSPEIVSIAMIFNDVISTPTHVIDDGISIDTHPQ
eukprot:Lithocolla_globosa_v1_NODE_3144_length_1752_cov_11.468474.p2 type:complete len:134 gc:universal NODE_3144_length_1752_cov_11.468474:727-1128(+)